MADLQTVIQSVDELSASDLKQLYNHILETHIQFVNAHEASDLPGKRILGLHESLGHAWMSDDFNDELPQAFWLDEDSL